MSHLLEILGRGLLSELAAAFRKLLTDDGRFSTVELREQAAESPNDLDAQKRLGARHLADRNYVAARDVYRTCVDLAPDDTTARAGLACAMDELGDAEGSIRQLQTARLREPENGPLLFALGYSCERAGQTEQAIEAYQAAVKHAPHLRNSHERLAAIYLKQKDVEQAIDHYEHLCFSDPGEVGLSLALAHLYLQVGMADEAIRRFHFALTIEPDNWEVRNDLAGAYEEAGLYREAIDQLEKSLKAETECAGAHLRLGDLYTKLRLDEPALGHYTEALRIHPEYLEATIKVGTAHLRAGDYLQAAQWFNKAVEINDRLLSGYVGLAVAQYEAGEVDEAHASLDLAAGAEPNSTLLFSEMARLQLKLAVQREADRQLAPSVAADAAPAAVETSGDLVDRQIERHRQAIEERPNHADLHYRLGLLLRHRSRVPEAVRSFQNALAINPHYLKAMIKLGLSLKEVGDTDAAIDTLQRALRIEPQCSDLYYELGLIFADQRKFTLAVERFETAIARNPRNIDFHANLALALQNMGLVDRAAASWQTLCDMLPESARGRAVLQQAARDRKK